MISALGLSGCASNALHDQPEDILERRFNIDTLAQQSDPEPDDSGEITEARPPQASVFPASGQVIRTKLPERQSIAREGETVRIDFEQAPLQEVIHAILGDVLEVNYRVEQPVEGAVTLRTHAPVHREDLLEILDTMLRANGAVLQEDGRDGYRVVPIEIARSSVRLSGPQRLPAGQAMVVVPLDYIGAAEMAEILTPVAPEGSILRVDPVRNLLMLAGSRDQLESWFDLVDTFDVDYLAGMSVGLFPLEFATVNEVHDAISVLIGERSQEQGQAGSLRGALRVLPIERLNSLLVVTPKSHYLDLVSTWVERLDRPVNNDLEPRLYVYPVQNGTASQLAELLTKLYGAGGGEEVSDSNRRSGVAPGLAPSRISDSSGDNPSGDSAQAEIRDLPDTGTGAPRAEVQTLDTGVRVVADENNNALLILAKRQDYRKIESALRELDKAPTQVLIEASIVEVTLRDGLEFGLEWHLQNSLGSGFTGISDLNMNAEGGIGAAQPGFSYSFRNPAGQLRAVFNALANDSLLRVLSNPSLLVLDHHTASIHVGDQQPVKSSTTQTEGGNVTEAIEYKDTGVMLSVTPSVNAGGLVSMDITQTVTDVGARDDATGQRSFLQRQVRSRVAVRSGESIVLGGLIRDNENQSKGGVPGLYRLPLIGGLFGTSERSTYRQELLVMITPRVLEHEAELRAISEEMRERVARLQRQGMSSDGI